MVDVAQNLRRDALPALEHVSVSHPLLNALDNKSLETLLGLSRVTTYRPKRTIVRAGEEARSAHLLLSGAARVFHRDERGEELTTLLLGAPSIFNDTCILAESRVAECVTTLERSTVLSVPTEVFRRLVSRRPQFNEALIRDQAARTCIASVLNRRLAFQDIDTRLASLLLDYAALVGTKNGSGHIRLRPPLSQQSMANDLGASRKSLNRALERLREIGAVLKFRARYEIRNIEELRERAGSPIGIRHTTVG